MSSVAGTTGFHHFHVVFCLSPSPIPRLPSIFHRPHLDSADKDKANQRRCILHYMYSPFWTLYDMLHTAPKTRLPCRTSASAYSRTHVPSAFGSDLIGVVISILTLCLASTGLEPIVRAIASSLRLPDLTVQCSDILRRPTARFNTGVCLSICTFPRRHHRSHLPTFPRHRDPFHLVHLFDQNYCQITQFPKDLSSP